MLNNLNQNSSTITGDVKSRIDMIWDTLWAGGITVPIENKVVISQRNNDILLINS